MRTIIDKDKCIGCALCESLCPAVFRMGDDGKAGVLVEPVPGHLEACMIEAKEACPVSAISVEP